MKMIVFALVVAAAISTGCASAQSAAQAPAAIPSESQLPSGMKQYWFVMLKRGPRRDQSADVARQLQAGHMANIEAYAKSGRLQIAGPFADDATGAASSSRCRRPGGRGEDVQGRPVRGGGAARMRDPSVAVGNRRDAEVANKAATPLIVPKGTSFGRRSGFSRELCWMAVTTGSLLEKARG